MKKRQKTVPVPALVWKQRDIFPRRFWFSANPGIAAADLDASSTKQEILLQFFPEELFTHIANQTNQYARDNLRINLDSHERLWFNTTAEEIKVMLSLVILMGITTKPHVHTYWARDPILQSPFFGNTMPRDRFLQWLKSLHFNDNDIDDGTDRLFKLRPVIDTLAENFKTVYVPSHDVTTDESLWKFYGRLKFKQYNPSKRARFGIKVYKTCQSTGDAAGYTWNFKIYTSQDQGDLPASTRSVLELNEDLLDQRYNIFLDNWFSSPDLFMRLRDQRTNACGTVRLNRKQMPYDLKTVKLKKRGEHAFRSTDSVLALVWKDKKDVKMLSTMQSASMEDSGKKGKSGNPIEKPNCFLEYNNEKCGVDLSDQFASSHHSVRKSIKWYKKICFLHG